MMEMMRHSRQGNRCALPLEKESSSFVHLFFGNCYVFGFAVYDCSLFVVRCYNF